MKPSPNKEQILKKLMLGQSATDLAKEYGISAATIYNWKSQEKLIPKPVLSDEQSNSEQHVILSIKHSKLKEMYAELALDLRLRNDGIVL